jgi:CBS-domain-containing membrane protein
MEAQRVHRLVVVADDGRTPIGILSQTDLVHALAGWED